MKLASIEIIKDIRPHPNADRLELATVLGWQTVVEKGKFTEGEKIIFITIDTIVPLTSWSQFLADKDDAIRPIRLKNIKLRGEYSSGLVLPLEVLDTVLDPTGEDKTFWKDYVGLLIEGRDITKELGIIKYEKPVDGSCDAVGGFPTSLVPTTDEDNGLSNPRLAEQVLSQEVTITLKYDGSSETIIIENGYIVNVCSRKQTLKDNDNTFWKAARDLVIPEGWTGIIQGELLSQKVQKNIHGVTKPTLVIFQIRKDSRWLNYEELKDECKLLQARVAAEIIVPFESDTLPHYTLAGLQKHADNLILENGRPAEGIVVRTENYNSWGIGRPFGFKLINRNYKD